MDDFPIDQPHFDAGAASALMRARRTVLPKRLEAPGPEGDELVALLEAAASAPDHGQLLPWRFVLVPADMRGTLGDVFAQALQERDGLATSEQIAQAREKAHRSPTLLLLVVDGAKGDPDVDLAERLISAGCAVQNILLAATAMGYGSALTSGKALKSQALRECFALQSSDHAVCFISVGRAASVRAARQRPTVNQYLSVLQARSFDPLSKDTP